VVEVKALACELPSKTGLCVPTTGIEPYHRLVGLVMGQEPYRSARRVFWTSRRTTKRLPGRLSGNSLGRSWTNSLSNSPDASSISKGPSPGGDQEYVTELKSQST
jgi:hypothetical protein